jgi:hypothetical protein
LAILDRGFFEFTQLMPNRFIREGLEDIPRRFVLYNFDRDNHGNPNYFYGVEYFVGNEIDDDDNGAIDDYWGYIAVPRSYYTVPHITDTHGAKILSILSSSIDVYGYKGMSNNIPQIKHFPIECTTPNNERGVLPAAVSRAFRYVLSRRKEYNNDPTTGIPFVAINCSFELLSVTDGLARTWTGLIDSLGVEGVLTVTSTGNRGNEYSFHANVESEYLITVTATHWWHDIVAPFANKIDQKADLAAPGVGICYYLSSTIWTPPLYHFPGNISYPFIHTDNSYWDGTSASVAFVVGTIGLMYRALSQEQLDNHTPSELALLIKQYLLEGIEPVDTLIDDTKHSGLLNARNAVLNVLDPPIWIREDTTISVDTIFSSRVIIVNGATLSIEDGIVSFDQNHEFANNHWIEIRDGKLVLFINNFRSISNKIKPFWEKISDSFSHR